jgi:hypothetical protein
MCKQEASHCQALLCFLTLFTATLVVELLLFRRVGFFGCGKSLTKAPS